MEKIKIKIGNIEVEGEILDTKLGKKIIEKIPFSSKANLWGDEIYFEVDVDEKLEMPVSEVEKGDIGYWPTGKCFCLFFGPTPISYGDKIIPASKVEIVGKITKGIEKLKQVKERDEIIVEKG
ncbi:MAG TPA: cyclophilin-like fold protein [Candidatus Ratteibacteria bacterium]|nr:cyclophilin-like fold protein [bacterium]HRR96764.1 cyclophilin-like fold protein [Candidatus Ratteibacteria bacterium]